MPMRRYATYESIQCLGQNMQIVSSGLGSFWRLTSRFMLEENLGMAGPDGLAQFEPDEWYPLAGHLRVLERIRKDFGEVALRQVGASIPRFARAIPAGIDVRSAFQHLDVTYHINHAVNGQPMFSEHTGQLQDGIGHYLAHPFPRHNQILCECTGPYPCAFDEGLLLAFARFHEPSATLTHHPGKCRNQGGTHCTYSVAWK
ncbi:hypothetical protein [Cystobacter ferrugineus]|uniref:4-vinyl reductase 4VR domain-containing protein n=1 Tax=Cystobacter ferrugineus TaxID=83449 RepID=A0A1L9B017_9BACT|nr:hypothetical protein [Cystobacter ferrugineus]OJH35594.1 hypothetical protein BON30_36580 [Cystobacter ferrugineus]